jgi:hypothetical protein
MHDFLIASQKVIGFIICFLPKPRNLRVNCMTPTNSPQYATFTEALRRVLQVTPAELKARLAAEKKAKTIKPRPLVSVRVSRAKV